MKDFIKLHFGVLFIIVLLILLQGCTWKPVQIKGQPDSCNDKLTFLREAKTMFGKSNAGLVVLLTLQYNDCKNDRKQLRYDRGVANCTLIVYGPKLLPKKDNWEKATIFMDCVKAITKDKF